MTLQRVSSRANSRPDLMQPVTKEEWLLSLMEERDWLIMRLRQVEKPLVYYGKLKTESIARRTR